MDVQEPAALAIVAAAAVMLLRRWRRRKTCSSCPAQRGALLGRPQRMTPRHDPPK